jgi:hypothetical protein
MELFVLVLVSFKLYTPCFIAAMVTSKKTTPKRGATVTPDDPRFGSGLNTLPEPSGLKKKVRLDVFYPPETVATTSTEKDSTFGCKDDDVLVSFNPCYIVMTPEMSSTGHFAEELFLDDKVAETAVGRIVGHNAGHFGLAMATPQV